MFEGYKHTVTNWYLEINGERVPYPRKVDAVRHGKLAKKIKPDTKLIKEQSYFFGKVKSEMKRISHREYDRTILLQE